MSDEEDRLIDVLLDRVLGGRRPPDLAKKIVARAYPRRRRILGWAAGAAAVLLVAFLLVVGTRGRYPLPHLDGEGLARGALVLTPDRTSTLTLGGYCRIQVEPASRLRIEGAERAEAIFLERGGVACEVDRHVGGFAVRTRACTVSASATRFAVRILDTKPDERVFVSVQDGSVLVAGRGGERTLEAGQEFASPTEAALPREEAKPAVLSAKGPAPGERATVVGMAKALPPDARGERNPLAANATLTVTTTGSDGKEAEVVYDVAGWAGVILAKAGDGKKAEVTGVVSEKDGKRRITGKSVDVKIIIVEETPKSRRAGMVHRATWVALAIGLVGLALTGAAPTDVQTITGIVRAAAPEAREAATVRVGDVVYKVTKDDNGRKVASEANGKKAEIKGNVEDKDGVKWITVLGAKLVE